LLFWYLLFVFQILLAVTVMPTFVLVLYALLPAHAPYTAHVKHVRLFLFTSFIWILACAIQSGQSWRWIYSVHNKFVVSVRWLDNLPVKPDVAAYFWWSLVVSSICWYLPPVFHMFIFVCFLSVCLTPCLMWL